MKKLKTLLSVLLAFVMIFSATACKGEQTVDIDDSKTQIYVYARSQGLGYEFLTKLADDFNAKPGNEDYQVIAQWGDDELTSTVSGQLDAGICTKNIYFGGQSNIMAMISQNKLVDLTDVYEMKVDGADKGTIKDKTINYDDYERIFTKLDGSGGIYAMPFSHGFAAGLVFDYQNFLKNGFLDYAPTSELDKVNEEGEVAVVDGDKLKVTVAFGNYNVDDYVLTAGKDGKYGTYDDGQKTTAAGFKELVEKIINKGQYPFLYTTQYAGGYTQSIFTSYLAQIMGLDNFKAFTNFSGDIKGADGTVQKTLNITNGNEAWATDAVKNAYVGSATFFNDYLLGNLSGQSRDKMLHKGTYSNNVLTEILSHRDAQDFFVGDVHQGAKQAAFLIEGGWWEREAQSTLEGYGEFGSREFRLYLLPAAENQITPADQTVFYSNELSAAMIFNNYPEKIKDDETAKAAFMQKCKEFLAYTCSDEACVYYTQHQGLMRGFKYEIPEEVYENLTPFQRIAFEIMSDTEHIKIANSQSGPENLMRSYQEVNNVKCKIENVGYIVPYTALQKVSPTDYYNAVKSLIDSEYQDKLAIVKADYPSKVPA